MVKVLLCLLLVSDALQGMQCSVAGAQQRAQTYSFDTVLELKRREDARQDLMRKIAEIPTDYTGLTDKKRAQCERKRAMLERILRRHEALMAEFLEDIKKRKAAEMATEASASAAAPVPAPEASAVPAPQVETKRAAQANAEAKTAGDDKRNAEEKAAGDHKRNTDEKSSGATQRTVEELRACEQFKKRFVEGFSKTAGYNDLVLLAQNKFKMDLKYTDELLHEFLSAVGDEAYFPMGEMMQNIDAELRQCRGGRAGAFVYNAYNPAWCRAVHEKHRNLLGVQPLLERAVARCLQNHEGEESEQLLFKIIKEYLERDSCRQARLLFVKMESFHQIGYKKFIYTLYMNPRRAMVLAVAAVVVVAGAYRYYTREY
jgi:hypothetical protein